MAGEQSWGGIISTFDDCVLLLDSNITAPWTSQGSFDATLVCPNQLTLEQHCTKSKNEEAEFPQSPSDSGWETIYDSEIDELEDLSTPLYDNDDIDESERECEKWEEFLEDVDVSGRGVHEDTPNAERILVAKNGSAVPNGNRWEDSVPVEPFEVVNLVAKQNQEE